MVRSDHHLIFGDVLRIGVQVDVEAEVDGWLHCVNRYGVKGLVPSSYIRILGPDDAAEDVASRLFGGPRVKLLTLNPKP